MRVVCYPCVLLEKLYAQTAVPPVLCWDEVPGLEGGFNAGNAFWACCMNYERNVRTLGTGMRVPNLPSKK